MSGISNILKLFFILSIFSCRTNSAPNSDTKNTSNNICTNAEIIKYLDDLDKMIASPSVWKGYVHDDIQLFVQLRGRDEVLARNISDDNLSSLSANIQPCYKEYKLTDIKIKLPENDSFSFLNVLSEDFIPLYAEQGYEQLAKYSFHTKKPVTTMLIPGNIEFIENIIPTLPPDGQDLVRSMIENITLLTAKIFIHESFHAYQQKWKNNSRGGFRDVVSECKVNTEWFAKFNKERSWWNTFIPNFKSQSIPQLQEMGLKILNNRMTNDESQKQCWTQYQDMEKSEGTANFVDVFTYFNSTNEEFTMKNWVNYLNTYDDSETSEYYATGAGILYIVSKLSKDQICQTAIEEGSTPFQELEKLLK